MANVYDERIDEYNKQIKNTQNEMSNLATEKQNVLDTYEKNYNEQLTNYNELMAQEKANIDTWAETQKETQQKQTDFNIGLINQAKQEAETKTNAEIGNAYIDYQKGLNQFGGSAETLASQGLTGTGFAKNQDIAMNITYQNRVASAKSALQKANVDYDNQIQQALLTNDAQLAEVALKQMEQSYALALKGFEYTTTLQNNRLNYIQGVNDSYFNKNNTLQSRLDSYNSTINSLKVAKHNEELAQQQAAAARYYSSGGGNSNTSNNKSVTIPSNVVGSAVSNALGYATGSSNSKTTTSSGYSLGKETNAALNNGMKPTNVKVGSVYGNSATDGNRNIANQYIWEKNGKKYIYYNAKNTFVEVGSVPSLVKGSIKNVMR